MMKIVTDRERKIVANEIIKLAEKEIKENGKFEYRISQNWWGNHLTRLSQAHEERLYDKVLDLEEDNNWNDEDINGLELDNRYKGIKDALEFLENKYNVSKTLEQNQGTEKEVTIEIVTITK